MTCNFRILGFATFLIAVTAQARFADPSDDHVVFRAQSGAVIVWDKRTGKLRTPNSRAVRLFDCGDEYQTCLTDHHKFAFAYFRNCNDSDYKLLKFHPQIVSALYNDLWMIFDAAPNLMFHYAIPKGVVGIYIARTPSFDFRLLFHDKNLNLNQFEAMEYRLTGSNTMAACETR